MVDCVQLVQQLLSRLPWLRLDLAASIEAARGAGHDLNIVILARSPLDLAHLHRSHPPISQMFSAVSSEGRSTYAGSQEPQPHSTAQHVELIIHLRHALALSPTLLTTMWQRLDLFSCVHFNDTLMKYCVQELLLESLFRS